MVDGAKFNSHDKLSGINGIDLVSLSVVCAKGGPGVPRPSTIVGHKGEMSNLAEIGRSCGRENLWEIQGKSCNNAGFGLTCRSLLCRVIIACCFRVAALSGHAALAFHRAAIAPELNRIHLSVICRGGQSGKVIDLLAWRRLPLGHPSAASGACAVVLISSSKRHCGKWQVSLKPA